MDSHFMTFVTIGNRVSPSSSVNGNPLFNFPDHWQPRFSPSFPFAGQVKGRTGPFERKICPLSPARESRAVKPWGLLSRSCHLRDKMFTHRRTLIGRGTNGLSGARFCWSRDRFVA